MSNQGSSSGPSQPQWLGLLQWSLRYQDGTRSSNVREMSTDDAAWLERVMREGIKDEPKRITEILINLKGEVDAGQITEEDTIEELSEMVEQIDNAQVFTKLGGLKLFSQILRLDSTRDSVRLKVLGVIGAVAQNNPDVQGDAVQRGLVEQLSELILLADESSLELKAKALFAISSIIRGFPAGERAFVLGSMIRVFADVLSPSASAHANLTRRALFLANALVSSDTVSVQRVQLLAPVILPRIVACMESEDLNVRNNSFEIIRSFLRTAEGTAALRPYQQLLLEGIERCRSCMNRTALATQEDEVFLAEDLAALADIEAIVAKVDSTSGETRIALQSEEIEEDLGPVLALTG
jgi:hypothetical protein